MDKELLNELSQNNGYDDIRTIYTLLVESIRHNLSAKLMETDEEHPLEVHIPLERGACGLSTLEMPIISSLYQMPYEGIICVKYESADDYIDLDDLCVEDMMQIVGDLE